MPVRAISPAPPVPAASSGLTLLFCSCFSEVELPLKKDGFTSESTTLEALLRGEGVEKKVDAREEESIQEIQVFLCPSGDGGLVPPEHHRRASRTLALARGLLSRARAASQTASWHCCQEACRFFSDFMCFPEEVIDSPKSVPLHSAPRLCTQNVFFGPAVCQA